MKFRRIKVTRRQRLVTNLLAGATVVAFLAILGIIRGEPVLGILLVIAVVLAFVPLGMWVSDILWGKAED